MYDRQFTFTVAVEPAADQICTPSVRYPNVLIVALVMVEVAASTATHDGNAPSGLPAAALHVSAALAPAARARHANTDRITRFT